MEKINVAELLHDCPRGTELDCTIWENVTFEEVRNNNIIIRRNNKEPYFDTKVNLNQYGCLTNYSDEKCIIFPKGKTTWEGFVPPFKDGDIVTARKDRGSLIAFIYKERKNTEVVKYHFVLNSGNVGAFAGGEIYLAESELVFATEEEKQKLFDAIKANGYKWNEENKTLEKLPKFKVGDTITNGKTSITIGYIDNEYYYEISRNIANRLFIKNQDDWELVPEKLIQPKFKVWDRIKHKDDETIITVTGIKDDYYFIQYYNIRKLDYQNEKVSFKDQDKYELVINKFDINTLVPFESKVLVRNFEDGKWRAAFWGFYNQDEEYHPYSTTLMDAVYCIPYEGNEHLLGKTDDCNEYFKTWSK